MQKILITGGTGFIGSHLVDAWLTQGHQVTVLTRRPQWVRQRWQGKVVAVASISELAEPFDGLMNLAGEGIADKRWSAARKQQLRDSRIGVTNDLVDWAQVTKQQFEWVMTGSAVGFYGGFDCLQDQGEPFNENAQAGNDFSAQLCQQWEQAAEPLQALTKQFVILRTGVVLGPNQGMLKRLWLPFSVGLGGVIGSGRQVLPWIHIQDFQQAVDFILAKNIQGVVNMTSGNSVDTNKTLTKSLSKVLARPALLPMPTWIAKCMFGQMSQLLLQGQAVAAKKLHLAGFKHQFSDLDNALQNIHKQWQ